MRRRLISSTLPNNILPLGMRTTPILRSGTSICIRPGFPISWSVCQIREVGSAGRTRRFAPSSVLLSQIGTQISLVLDNALAYGRLRQSHDVLEDQRLYLEAEISSEFNFERRRQKYRNPENLEAGGHRGADRFHGAAARRNGHRQRASCAGRPPRQSSAGPYVCEAELRSDTSGLLESELFGHEKGAFTGALMQKKGRFEIADRGTLFLDEIGDISMELQPKLLRAVQEQEFERLGSTRTTQVNVRLIAATHRDIAGMIREGKFREDLFYRLNVFPIEIPPLRNVPETFHCWCITSCHDWHARCKRRSKLYPNAQWTVW